MTEPNPAFEDRTIHLPSPPPENQQVFSPTPRTPPTYITSTWTEGTTNISQPELSHSPGAQVHEHLELIPLSVHGSSEIPSSPGRSRVATPDILQETYYTECPDCRCGGLSDYSPHRSHSPPHSVSSPSSFDKSTNSSDSTDSSFHRHLELMVLKACISGNGWDGFGSGYRENHGHEIEERHAHCKIPGCPFKKSYIQRGAGRFHFDWKCAGPSQAALLGRHEECTCRVVPMGLGCEPALPHHAMPLEFIPSMTPRIQYHQERDRYILRDREHGVWYLMRERDLDSTPTEPLKIIASGKYNPIPNSERTLSSTEGVDCPCYDEFHGEGASAIAKAEITRLTAEMERRPASLNSNRDNRLFYALQPAGFNYQNVESAANTRMKHIISKLPWISKSVAWEKAKDDAIFFSREYYIGLSGKATSEDIVNFYEAQSFEGGESIEYFDKQDSGIVWMRIKFPEINEDGKPYYHRAISVLTNFYLSKIPWLAVRLASRKALLDTWWLHDQYTAHFNTSSSDPESDVESKSENKMPTEEDIVMFFGGNPGHESENGQEIAQDDRDIEDAEIADQYRILYALAKRCQSQGRGRKENDDWEEVLAEARELLDGVTYLTHDKPKLTEDELIQLFELAEWL